MNSRKKYLCGKKILPLSIKPNMRIEELVNLYNASGAYQGGRLGQACLLFEKMLNEGTTVALTLAGAMTPAGMGGLVISLMERGLIDFIIATGANLYHDIHFALDFPVHQGSFNVDDAELFESGIERIYDIFITEELLYNTDVFVRDVSAKMNERGPISTAKYHHLLGRAIIEETPYPERSLLAAAARFDIPVYTSSPGDSSIGMNLAELILEKRPTIEIDPNLDVLETCGIVHSARKNGVVIIGGGSPKNFYLQTQPMLWQMIGKRKGGHNYDIQIGTDVPHWGGLSGATPSEAVSWGKVDANELSNSVVLYSDATIALPILTSYVLSKVQRRPHKRLFKKREASLKKLYRLKEDKK